MGLDGAHIALLVPSPGFDIALFGADDRKVSHGAVGGGFDHRLFHTQLQVGLLQEEVHRVRRQIGLRRGLLVEIHQQIARGLGVFVIPVEGEDVAAVVNLDIETLLDLAEVLVELSAETGESTGVVGFECDCQCVGVGIQTCRVPLLAGCVVF